MLIFISLIVVIVLRHCHKLCELKTAASYLISVVFLWCSCACLYSVIPVTFALFCILLCVVGIYVNLPKVIWFGPNKHCCKVHRILFLVTLRHRLPSGRPFRTECMHRIRGGHKVYVLFASDLPGNFR